MHEVLFARRKDIGEPFRNAFQGMCRDPVELGELLEARNQLWNELPGALTVGHEYWLKRSGPFVAAR